MNYLESRGYNVIMDEIRLGVDFTYDPWGSNGGWMKAIADYMWVGRGEIMPGYQPSLLTSLGLNQGDMSYELEFLISQKPSATDLRRVYAVLNRYDDLLRLVGKNY